jgi:hypothetical protein
MAESCGGALPDTSRSPISRVSWRYAPTAEVRWRKTLQFPKPGDAQCLRCLYLQRVSLSGRSIDGISWRCNPWDNFYRQKYRQKISLGGAMVKNMALHQP